MNENNKSVLENDSDDTSVVDSLRGVLKGHYDDNIDKKTRKKKLFVT